MLRTLSLLHFWLSYPALLYGIAFLLGLFCQFRSSIWLVIPCLSLWLPFFIAARHAEHRNVLKYLALSLLAFFTAWSTANIHYSFPSLSNQKVSGIAYVKIKNLRIQQSLFGERWLYQCELQQFFPTHQSSFSMASSLPCLIALPAGPLQKHPRPLAHQDYWVSGQLMQIEKGSYLLKVSPKTIWTAVLGTWSWAEKRYQWKKTVSQWIESQFSHPLSASFLAGLATGEFDDYWMRQQFARFGLQHLLAISGFHFAIMAGFLSFAFRLFLPERTRIVSLLICLAAYSFFLGPQASILRAWIMCSLTLLGGLIDKQTTALNSLGIALLIILGYNPLFCQELGFQLSFTTTAAILLFYQPAQAWLYELFPKRRLSDVLELHAASQHAYCLLAFLRQGLALTIAVNIFALPLTLYHFHQFPWMSLLYNLFFPFLASLSICLLLLGSFLAFFPFLASFLHSFNNAYTGFLLQLTYQIPSEIDTYLTINSLHPLGLILYLCLATLGGILWKESSISNTQQNDFTFI